MVARGNGYRVNLLPQVKYEHPSENLDFNWTENS